LALSLLVPVSTAGAQKVLIQNGSSTAVLEALKANLLPQGFTLKESNKKGALFTLDRGNVIQSTGPIASVHVVIELQFRYRSKPNGLEVSASEEAVGATGSSMMDFRRPVESPKELANLQQLLDSVRVTLETRSASVDSVAKVDSGTK
jgi:hypothetical protein